MSDGERFASAATYLRVALHGVQCAISLAGRTTTESWTREEYKAACGQLEEIYAEATDAVKKLDAYGERLATRPPPRPRKKVKK